MHYLPSNEKYYKETIQFRRAILGNSIKEMKEVFKNVNDADYFFNVLNNKPGKMNILILALGFDKTHDRKIISFLLENGCDPNRCECRGSNILTLALSIRSHHSLSEVFDLLLKHGSNVYAKDSEGHSVLNHAIDGGHRLIAKKLKRRIRKDLSKLRKILFNASKELNEDCLRHINSFLL